MFRVIDQVDGFVTGQRVSHGDIRRHDLPLIKRVFQVIMINDLIMVAVHNKVIFLYLRYVGRYA